VKLQVEVALLEELELLALKPARRVRLHAVEVLKGHVQIVDRQRVQLELATCASSSNQQLEIETKGLARCE
jgi:hypothetical protein